MVDSDPRRMTHESGENSSNSEGSEQTHSSGSSSVNWNLVFDSYPIPREMPAGESDTPLGAGFAPEWVERSLRNRDGVLMRHDGTSPFVDPKPMILDIVSSPKAPDDNWSYGVEYEIRRIVEREFKKVPPPDVSRIFCNVHGCLIYLEFQHQPVSKLGLIPNAILRSDWRADFGIKEQMLFDLIGRRDDMGIRWQLFMIHRHPSKSKATRASN